MLRPSAAAAVAGGTPHDPVVGAASAVVGGPRGRYAGPPPPRDARAGPVLALASALAVAASVLFRDHCRTTGWASPDQLVHACYSDVASRVASGTVAQQPPGAALVTKALVALVGVLGDPEDEVVRTFDLSAVLGALALALAALALVALTRRRGRPWAASALALSPLVVASGLVSLELLAVAGVALGLLAHARGAPALCGAAIAAAATVDPLAAVVLLALWTATLGAGGAPALRRAGAGAAGALAVLLAVAAAWVVSGLASEAAGGAPATDGADPSPVSLGALARALAAWAPDWSPVAGYGSLWIVPSLPGAPGAVPGPVVVAGALAGILGAVALVAVLAHRWAPTPQGPGPARLALAAVALVMVTAPAVPLQSSLLLLPLLVAAGLPWRLSLPWALVECAAGVITWLFVYGQEVPARGAEPWTYAVAVIARLAAVAALAAWALRRGSAPEGVESTPGAH